MKVCVIKTSSMGDVIHTLPALTDAQRAIPNLSIDWVVEENFAEIPSWHSAVNQIIPIALRRWRKSPFSAQTKNEWKSYRTLLQANQYDAVIDAQGLFKSAFFATRLVNGVKHGYDRKSIREPIASFSTIKIRYFLSTTCGRAYSSTFCSSIILSITKRKRGLRYCSSFYFCRFYRTLCDLFSFYDKR